VVNGDGGFHAKAASRVSARRFPATWLGSQQGKPLYLP